MSITGRTRYEVLRRDGFACYYCHGTKPLTVDHVIPLALGGTDDPSNLVASCAECNSGKSSTVPDGSLDEGVAEDARRMAEVITSAWGVVREAGDEWLEYRSDFASHWPYDFPEGWASTVHHWYEMGVPLAYLLEAADIASGQRRFGVSDRWRYFCGVVWNKTREVGAVVIEHSTLDGSFYNDERLTEVRIEAYRAGAASCAPAEVTE